MSTRIFEPLKNKVCHVSLQWLLCYVVDDGLLFFNFSLKFILPVFSLSHVTFFTLQWGVIAFPGNLILFSSMGRGLKECFKYSLKPSQYAQNYKKATAYCEHWYLLSRNTLKESPGKSFIDRDHTKRALKEQRDLAPERIAGKIKQNGHGTQT